MMAVTSFRPSAADVPARLVALALAATAAACAGSRIPAPPPPDAPSVVRVQHGGRIIAVPLEDYVLGTVLAEVTPVGERPEVIDRIYEVQAVIARTYAASNLGRHHGEGFDLCDTTHCQIYDPARIRSSRFAAAAAAAVKRTAGEILTFGRMPAETLFHADCGGWTAAAESVWGGAPVPYLLARQDDVATAQHRSWNLDATADRLRAALNTDDRTRVGRRLDGIEIVSKDASGRAAGLSVRGERSYTVRGDDLRAVLNKTFGSRAIQSTRFTLSHRGTTYVFAGTGFGHGVGLCQVGAAARARRGDSLQSILSAYFPGAALRSPPPPHALP